MNDASYHENLKVAVCQKKSFEKVDSIHENSLEKV
jgi:hypothetical protein